MVLRIPSESDHPLATSSYLNLPPPKMSAIRNPSMRVRQAVRDNNVALLSRLQHKTDLRSTDKNRLTSLSWAAIEGSLEVFEWLLLDYGHDDQELSRDADNNTILHLLASIPSLSPSPYTYHLSSPAFPPRLQTLSIEEQCNVSLRMTQVYHTLFPFLLDWSNSGGKTALHVAAQAGNWRFISFLCDLGADVDLTDLQGNTPLHYASAWGHLDTIRVLLERGSGYSARNFEGFTSSDFAYSERVNNGLLAIAREVIEERRSRSKRKGREDRTGDSMPNSNANGNGNSRSTTHGSASGSGTDRRMRSDSLSASSMGGSSSVGPASYGSQPGRYMEGTGGVPSGNANVSGYANNQPIPPLPQLPYQLQNQPGGGGYNDRTSSLPMSRYNSSTSASAAAVASGSTSMLSFPIPSPNPNPNQSFNSNPQTNSNVSSQNRPPTIGSNSARSVGMSASAIAGASTSTGIGAGGMGPPPLPAGAVRGGGVGDGHPNPPRRIHSSTPPPAAPQTVLGRPTPPLQPGTLQPPSHLNSNSNSNSTSNLISNSSPNLSGGNHSRPFPGRSPSMPSHPVSNPNMYQNQNPSNPVAQSSFTPDFSVEGGTSSTSLIRGQSHGPNMALGVPLAPPLPQPSSSQQVPTGQDVDFSSYRESAPDGDRYRNREREREREREKEEEQMLAPPEGLMMGSVMRRAGSAQVPTHVPVQAQTTGGSGTGSARDHSRR